MAEYPKVDDGKEKKDQEEALNDNESSPSSFSSASSSTASSASALEETMNDETAGIEDEHRRSLLRLWPLRGRSKNNKGNDAVPDRDRVDPAKAVCFVSIDAGMGSDLLNIRVLKRLDELLPEQGQSGKRLCHLENLSISGTHTHSAPAGFLQYTTFQITSYGFLEETMDAFVEGVAQSLLRCVCVQVACACACLVLSLSSTLDRPETSCLCDLGGHNHNRDCNCFRLFFLVNVFNLTVCCSGHYEHPPN